MNYPLTPEQAFSPAIPPRFVPVLQELGGLKIDYAITGSLGLKLLGVIDREAHDLDLVVPDPYDLELGQHEQLHSTNYGSIEDMEHIPYRILGQSVCFFVHKSISTVTITLPEGVFKVTVPEVTIAAKLEILKVRLKLESYDHATVHKHLHDVQAYFEWHETQNPINLF